MAHLEIIKGDRVGRIAELDEDRMVIGRHPTSQIVLENAAVSRQHAQVSRSRHGAFLVQDLRSRNGTIVNGSSVKVPTELSDGDEIRVCDVVFRFHADSPTDSDSVSHAESQAPATPASNPRATIEINVPEENQPNISEPGQSTILSKMSVASTALRLDVRSEQKLRAVLRLASAVANVLDLKNVLAAALDALFELFPQADEGFVILRHPTSGDLRVEAARQRTPSDTSVRVSRTIVNHVLDEGEAVLSADASKDWDEAESVSQARLRSMMCVPLLGKGDVRRGMIQLASRGLASQFKQEDLDVFVSVASQVALAVENSYLYEELVRQRDLDRELAFATQVQMGFLPKERPNIPGYEFYDYYEAALSIGGDYFDYLTLPDGQVVFSLGDVAGKGIAAALLMARLCSAARYHVLSQPNIAAALAELNKEITGGGLGHRFITFILASLDPNTGRVTMSNAGHLQPIVRRANGEVEILSAELSGMPLGVVSDQEFDQIDVELGPGDSIYLYTDGVTEAMNNERKLFRTDGVAKFLESAPRTLEDTVEGLVVDVERFTGGSRQADDMCIVGVQRLPEGTR